MRAGGGRGPWKSNQADRPGKEANARVGAFGRSSPDTATSPVVRSGFTMASGGLGGRARASQIQLSTQRNKTRKITFLSLLFFQKLEYIFFFFFLVFRLSNIIVDKKNLG